MYSITRRQFGYHLVFGGFIDSREMEAWLEELKVELASSPEQFGVFVDMRTLIPLPRDAQPFMQEGQRHYKENGMVRSVVILNNAATTMQFRRIARETGIDEWERYIDANAVDDWEEVGLKWVMEGIEPV